MTSSAPQQEEKRGPGAPAGNLNGLRMKRFGERLAIELLANDAKRLKAITIKLLQLAEKGDMQAIKEVLDRCDGRVPAGVELTGANGGELVVRDVGTAIGTARRVAFAMSYGALKLVQGGKPDEPAPDTKEA